MARHGVDDVIVMAVTMRLDVLLGSRVDVVPTWERGEVITREALQRELAHLLEQFDRLRVSDAAMLLRVDDMHVTVGGGSRALTGSSRGMLLSSDSARWAVILSCCLSFPGCRRLRMRWSRAEETCAWSTGRS